MKLHLGIILPFKNGKQVWQFHRTVEDQQRLEASWSWFWRKILSLIKVLTVSDLEKFSQLQSLEGGITFYWEKGFLGGQGESTSEFLGGT